LKYIEINFLLNTIESIRKTNPDVGHRINKERRACELRRGGTVLCGDRGEHGEGGHAGVRFIGMSGLNFPEESD